MHSALSEHLRLELAAAHVQGRPLDPGQPVPGCGCPSCTGFPKDHPARIPAWRRQDPKGAARSDAERRTVWKRRLEAARAVSSLDIARLLGCGDPEHRGSEWAVRCPLHRDGNPSLRIDPDTGLWYCDPCGEGGDGLRLFMRAKRLDFVSAVKEITA